jgi:D-alanyl-D-alanine carboxypeptidase
VKGRTLVEGCQGAHSFNPVRTEENAAEHTTRTASFPGYLKANLPVGPLQHFTDALIASPKNPPPPEELLSFVEDEPLKFDPGSRYEYSNSDNIVVGLMVEAATNRSYESQLQKYVFGPLGLTETSLPVGANLLKPFIHGLDPSQTPPEDVSEIIAAGWASGGIVSTPRDLNRFIRDYVGGQLFGSRVRSKQRQVIEGGGSEPPGPGKNSAGLGIFRYETRCGTV